MSSPEFAAWLAFDTLYPIGNRRHDVLHAARSASISAMLGDKSTDFATHDLFSDRRFDEDIEDVDLEAKQAEQLARSKATIMALTRSLGGTVVLHGDDSKSQSPS